VPVQEKGEKESKKVDDTYASQHAEMLTRFSQRVFACAIDRWSRLPHNLSIQCSTKKHGIWSCTEQYLCWPTNIGRLTCGMNSTSKGNNTHENDHCGLHGGSIGDEMTK